mmetsp:Transcript_18710/g.33949  ORF Transcript_18710/g.33949 Transcript_18710/m.33949 type:complete len:932 (-) Transcript_18710:1162-3957(-)
MSGNGSQWGNGWGSSKGWNSSQQQQQQSHPRASWQASSSSRGGPRDPSRRGDDGRVPRQHPPPVHNEERIPRRPKLDHHHQATATSSFSSSSSLYHVRHSNHQHNNAQPAQSMYTTKKEDPQMMVTTATPTKKEEVPTKSEPSFSTTSSIVNQVKVEDPNQTTNLTDSSVMSPADWEQKLLSQFRFPPEKYHLPAEAFVPDNVNRMNKKKEASEVAIQKVMKKMRDKALREVQEEQDDEDDDDSYVSSDSERKQRNRLSDRFPYEAIQIKDFFNAVPDCLPFTMGFDVFGLRDKDEENCLCPCGKDLFPWHNQHRLEGVGINHCKNSKYTPMGLMRHLRTEGEKGCILHYGLTIYMEHLYCKNSHNYRGGVGHKALYEMNDANYKIAVAAEKRELHHEILVGRQKLEEEKARRMQLEHRQIQQTEQLEFLQKTNKDAFQKIKQLEEDKKALHIEEKGKTPVLSKFELDCYRKSMDAYFGLAKAVASSKLETEEGPLCVEVHQENGFSLQNFFNKWSSRRKDKKTASLLFCDLNYGQGKREMKNFHGMKIISKWNVQFKNEINYGRTAEAKEQKVLDTAIDEGGPTREFLSQCWMQMGDLKLPVEGGTDVSLFEKHTHGWVPITDEMLRTKLKAALKENGRLSDDSEYAGKIEQARMYYRAIGRIMLHALATGNTIWSSSMTPLYQNWLLRGCRPGDEDYHKEDILKHLGEKMRKFLGVVHEFKDGTEEVLNEENIFTKFIPEQYLSSREDICLESMKEGLTLGGDYNLPGIFRTMPLEAVQKLIFSCPVLTAQAIIDILVPDYCVGWEGSKEDGKGHRRMQEDFFRDLCDILKEREHREKELPSDKLSFLCLFVAFCTGYAFLPDPMGNPNFKINVWFNFPETRKDDYPVSHTCDNMLTLPGYLYTNPDRDNFERILDESIYGSVGRLDMN